MTYLSKQKVRDIILNAPDGTTSEGIVAALRAQGHTLEGYPEEEKTSKKSISTLNSVAGLLSRVLEVPAAVATTAAQTVGGVIGGLSVKGGRKVAEEAVLGGLEQIQRIPGQVRAGAEEGFFAPSGMPSPAKALGAKGVAGFAVDVLGDPLNLISLLGATDDVARVAPEAKSIFREFGEKLFQSVLKPSNADEASEFKKLGRVFEEAIKKNVDTLGSRFSKYNVKGSFKNMIKTINQRIPNLSKAIDVAASKLDDAGRSKDISDILEDLSKYSDELLELGDDTGRIVKETVENAKASGTEMAVSEAIRLRRLYDKARLTAGGALSEAKTIRNQVFKKLSDGLRNKINKLPEIGELNKELSTYYDALKALSKEAAKNSKKFPGLSTRFPFISASLPGVKTTIADFSVSLGQKLNVPAQTVKDIFGKLKPGLLRQLMEELKD